MIRSHVYLDFQVEYGAGRYTNPHVGSFPKVEDMHEALDNYLAELLARPEAKVEPLELQIESDDDIDDLLALFDEEQRTRGQQQLIAMI